MEVSVAGLVENTTLYSLYPVLSGCMAAALEQQDGEAKACEFRTTRGTAGADGG